MRILRDNSVRRFFDSLEPIDRATLLIVIALCLALGLSVHVLWPRVAA